MLALLTDEGRNLFSIRIFNQGRSPFLIEIFRQKFSIKGRNLFSVKKNYIEFETAPHQSTSLTASPQGEAFENKAMVLAFPPGGKCRRTATNEGQLQIQQSKGFLFCKGKFFCIPHSAKLPSFSFFTQKSLKNF